MRKQVFGRRFKRDHNQRKALFKGLISALVLHGRITTTEAKAKAIKGEIEKLVTLAKKNKEGAKRLILPYVPQAQTQKLIGDIAPLFANRAGGYTRIIRKGKRFSDNAMMVVLEWSEQIQKPEVGLPERKAGVQKSEKIKKPATTETQKKSETRKLSVSVVARKRSKKGRAK